MTLVSPPTPAPTAAILTPLYHLPRLSEDLGIDLSVKREDLYPQFAGGNKARKMCRVLPSLRGPGARAVVTTGSTRSNHARVVALAAAQEGWPCHLVLHGPPEDLARTANGRMVCSTDAVVELVAPDAIAAALDRAVERLDRAGHRTHLIPGGGHTVDAAMAYVDAFVEIVAQQRRQTARPPLVVVVASGTGSTHAGLHAGAELVGAGDEVIGVSIARPRARATPVVERAVEEVRRRLPAPVQHQQPVQLHDTWREGGYGCSSPRLRSAIDQALIREALVLDETYSGKAFLGLTQLVRTQRIPPGSTVCFVHTGGWSTITSRREQDHA